MLQNKPYSLTTSDGSKVVISVLLFSCLFTVGCDETFIPLQENEHYHFSIYGYLDASADTQWVRVMPVREALFFEPKPIDATVTLEHVETGESVVMNDSLFTFFQGYAYNFWTTLKLQPEQAYRITAEFSNGKTSHATVTIPPDFPDPQISPESSLELIRVKGVEQLADVRTLYFIQLVHSEEEFLFSFPHLSDTTRLEGGDYSIVLNRSEDLRELNRIFGTTPRTVTDRQIFIASAGPEFHHFPSIDEKIVILPDGVSNVVQGTGYLAGIISKTIPYESCYREGTTDLIPCELRPPPW